MGLAYDFQTVGEFLIWPKPQTGEPFRFRRLAWPGAASNYSVITDFAIQVGADVVNVRFHARGRRQGRRAGGHLYRRHVQSYGRAHHQDREGYVVALNSVRRATADITSGAPPPRSALAQHAAHRRLQGLLGDVYNDVADDLTLGRRNRSSR